jgi:DsbC/DsbD-like thiol-disulfide interchange protein
MIASTLRQCASAAAVGALLISVPCFEAAAAGASSWDGDARSAVRLVAGGVGNPSSDMLRAGLEFRLAPGWKTYWRYPGDSGVPPTFDFSKSENVKSIAILWPAPHRFVDDGGASIGYKIGVMLPLHIVPANPKRPVTLRLALDYAVCEKLCVPAKGAAKLDLARVSSPQEAAVAAAEALVPARAGLGETSPIAIRTVRRETGGARARVIVDVAAPAAPPLDLFVEGPTEDWALPLPEPIPGAAPGLRRFAFDLDGMPSGVDPIGAHLRFTLISGENAIEVTTDLK